MHTRGTVFLSSSGQFLGCIIRRTGCRSGKASARTWQMIGCFHKKEVNGVGWKDLWTQRRRDSK